jgi:hypothetical protein
MGLGWKNIDKASLRAATKVESDPESDRQLNHATKAIESITPVIHHVCWENWTHRLTLNLEVSTILKRGLKTSWGINVNFSTTRILSQRTFARVRRKHIQQHIWRKLSKHLVGCSLTQCLIQCLIFRSENCNRKSTYRVTNPFYVENLST